MFFPERTSSAQKLCCDTDQVEKTTYMQEVFRCRFDFLFSDPWEHFLSRVGTRFDLARLIHTWRMSLGDRKAQWRRHHGIARLVLPSGAPRGCMSVSVASKFSGPNRQSSRQTVTSSDVTGPTPAKMRHVAGLSRGGSGQGDWAVNRPPGMNFDFWLDGPNTVGELGTFDRRFRTFRLSDRTFGSPARARPSRQKMRNRSQKPCAWELHQMAETHVHRNPSKVRMSVFELKRSTPGRGFG